MADIKNLVCECSNCKKEFDLNADNLRNREVTADGENLTLKVITCPLCGHEHIVQIDNKETLELLNKQMLTNAVLGKLKVQRKSTGKYVKQYRRLKTVSTLLMQARKALVLKYNNSVYYFQNESKKISINEPTVKIVGDNNN